MLYNINFSTIGKSQVKNTLSYQSYLKSPIRSIKHSTYFDTYDDLFSRYRGQDITFVEVGVAAGGSLFMWRDFFGPQARIIGVDLNPDAKTWEKDGFEIFIGSQSDEGFWQDFIATVGPVDILLDDGGHTFEQQIITTELLLDNIKDNGMLIVEDTHTSYMPGFGEKNFSFMSYVSNFADKVNQRFGKFNDSLAEKRVWSVQIYESIVAFHINKQASHLQSTNVDNNGDSEYIAKDYRYSDIPVRVWGIRNLIINLRSRLKLKRFFQPKRQFKES